jgi:superfamily II DNA or RNA helicase
MPRIIDNINLKLDKTLSESLVDAKTFDAAVGYFNLRGWKAISDEIDSLPGDENGVAVRLLIGMRQPSADAEFRNYMKINSNLKNIDNATAAKLIEATTLQFKEQLSIGIPTSEDEQYLNKLREQLKSGKVKVKHFLNYNLHAKLYICHREDLVSPRIGFVGSSNLTFSGLSNQGELNVDVLDHDSTEKLHSWFEERWNDKFSVDVTDLLIGVIEQSWANKELVNPYLIHLKLAYHLSRDARAGLVEYGLPNSIGKELLEFQRAAVGVTIRNLINRGGAIIADVVGLGKTMVASAVALTLQEEHGYEVLIISPKNLVKMWEGYVARFRLHAKVISLTQVHLELENLRRFRLLIIDESHNLRNPKRRDYIAIRDYVTKNDPKVLLLTATPYNTSMSDVVGQLSLFLDEDQDLGIRPENAILKVGEYEFLRKCDDKPSTLRAFKLSDDDSDWQRLLAYFLIRRTRRFIKDNYAHFDDEKNRHYLLFADGEKNYLPDRVPRPLTYKVSSDDPSSVMESPAVLASIDELRLPRYQLSNYLLDDLSQLDSEQILTVDNLNVSGGNLIGFTRTMLMKRLASSGSVFIKSIERHLIRNHMYIYALNNNLDLPIGSFSENSFNLADDENEIDFELDNAKPVGVVTTSNWQDIAIKYIDQLKFKSPKNLQWLPSSIFDDKLLKDLQKDSLVLEKLIKKFGVWDESKDSKLESLYDLITKTHPTQKILVFTEFAETAIYIEEGLKFRGISKLASVTGESDNPTSLAKLFSPVSNTNVPGIEVSKENEIRILIATDVLSEGQNLQDCAIVINFDLPWAIIRLIQRAGRIDRIGQKSEKVLVYTFLPTEGVNAVLQLRERVAERLKRNASIFGADEKFLNTPGESKLISGLFDETAEFPEEENEGPVDFASEAYEIWKNAEIKYPEEAKKALELPAVAYASTKLEKNDSRNSGVLLYTLSNLGFDRLAFSDEEGFISKLTPHEALMLTLCEKNSPGFTRRPDHFEKIKEIITEGFNNNFNGLEGQLSGVRKRVYEKVRSLLAQREGTLFEVSNEVSEAVDNLFKYPLSEYSKQALSKSLRDRQPEDLLSLVITLHNEGRLVIENNNLTEDIQIVCSLGLRK